MEMYSEIILIVIGLILSGLGTNLVSSFRKMQINIEKMSGSMVEMNLKLAQVITKHDNTEEIAKQNQRDILNIRERIHTLEGRDGQILSFIEEFSKN